MVTKVTKTYLWRMTVCDWTYFTNKRASVGLWNSKQSAVSVWHTPVAVCTVFNSWWWTERPSETCSVTPTKQIWFYYRNRSGKEVVLKKRIMQGSEVSNLAGISRTEVSSHFWSGIWGSGFSTMTKQLVTLLCLWGEFLATNKMTFFPNPPYSPNSALWLLPFPKTKYYLKWNYT